MPVGIRTCVYIRICIYDLCACVGFSPFCPSTYSPTYYYYYYEIRPEDYEAGRLYAAAVDRGTDRTLRDRSRRGCLGYFFRTGISRSRVTVFRKRENRKKK